MDSNDWPATVRSGDIDETIEHEKLTRINASPGRSVSRNEHARTGCCLPHHPTSVRALDGLIAASFLTRKVEITTLGWFVVQI